ncbi:hypothetical protein [Xanthobacter versatilis]|uniref:hypothetical protein n=1 Tax=Xanthobacter autotrophicus (strain ATCC BAA-1158 / Py2) TaxID=78245 RepID=UPI003728A7D3
MARSFRSTDTVQQMLRNLMAAEALTGTLTATAPRTMTEAGGAQALVAAHGHPIGAWFWSISPVPVDLWERMAEEHQQASRASSGDT